MFKIKTGIISLVSSLVLSLSAASSFAGGELKKDPYAPLWQGLYFGGHVGVAYRDELNEFTVSDEARQRERDPNRFVIGHSKNNFFLSEEDDTTSFAGGVHLGYNFQKGNIVYGLEGSFTLTDAKEEVSVEARFIQGNNNEFVGRATSVIDLNYLASLRGRVGYATDKYLFYVTGGVAFAEVEVDLETNGEVVLNRNGGNNGILPNFNLTANNSIDDTYVGYVVGFGGEYKWSKNVSLRGQLLHHGFDDFDSTLLTAGVSWHY